MRFMLATVALLAIPSIARADFVTQDVLGCVMKRDIERVGRVILSGNKEGARDLTITLVRAGRCRGFGAGERVVIENTDGPWRCILPRSFADCYWVPGIRVKPSSN
jgi:hypothetical protein